MKEKEKSQILKTSVENQWLVTIIEKLISLMNECEHRPIGQYLDPDSDKMLVTPDDLNFLKGFLSLVEGYKQEDNETANLVGELKELNSRLDEIDSYCDEILEDKKISKIARSSIRTLKEEMKTFSERHNFEKSVVIGSKFISIEQLDSREVHYYNRIVRFLMGTVLKDLYELKPEQSAHA